MSRRPTRSSSAPPPGVARRVTVLAAVAAASVLPPYVGALVGLELNVSSTLEIIDHVVPGLLALASSALALWLVGEGRADSTLTFAALAACALAGLFQAVSHLGLVLDIGEAGRPAGAVVLHATPGFVLLAVSLWLLLAPQPVAPRR